MTRIALAVLAAAVWFKGIVWIQPRDSTPDLEMASVKFPGIVSAWSAEHFPARGPTQQDPHPSNPNMVNGSVQRSTVGVVPTPADPSAAALLTCLESLRKQACGRLRWIPGPSECPAFATRISRAAC